VPGRGARFGLPCSWSPRWRCGCTRSGSCTPGTCSSRATEVLHAWRKWTATVPEEVTCWVHLLRLPPLPEVPEPLRGRAFAILEAACLSDAGTGAELIGPLRRLGRRYITEPTR
jgi:hypothetical protein